jgi:hypothetical protein
VLCTTHQIADRGCEENNQKGQERERGRERGREREREPRRKEKDEDHNTFNHGTLLIERESNRQCYLGQT